MTQEQIEQFNNQSAQDAITLDYAKWSFQQIQAKRSNDHELWEQERDKVLTRQHYDNEAAKSRHLESLEATRADRTRERNGEIDRHLEPQKQKLMREWLANNPNETPAGFEKKAWLHLRQNLVEKAENDAMQATTNDLRATGKYSL